ncbi:tail fiber protein [Fulvivirga sp. 29W222]|uniref:Tail fiber protein n=1 Tax=Fulvivirga marina TaxID=2494733 RepID=A0A937FY77_9BACT|nr:tail fiber protein [Fulvivirga marina]MBL6446565.1 tail fiber protein [Fulvivirga marina]
MRTLLFLCAYLFTSVLFGQVGVNNPNPDPSSILDINANDKGILIPRMTSAEMTLISSPAEGLLVYNKDESRFYFYNAGWFALNEMVRSAGSSDISHTGDVNVTGEVSATSYGLNASGNGPVPKGGIIMWSGSTPPTGWALCNGTNGTPDLRGRFIIGYNPSVTDYNQPGNRSTGGATNGKTGGSESVTLTQSQMPSHSHGNGTLYTQAAGNHTHTVPMDQHGAGGSNVVYSPTGQNGFNIADPTTSTAGSHTHTILGATATAGSSQAHENRPPYYVLAFIMKL